jgi:O-antigen/teichoic acid export membrane protein
MVCERDLAQWVGRRGRPCGKDESVQPPMTPRNGAVARIRRGLRAELTGHVGFNGLAQIAPMVVTLALTPLLLDRLGLDRYGVWALAIVVLSTLTALDGGIAASLARYFAVYGARGDREDSGRLLVASLLFSISFGLLLTVVAFVVAPVAVSLLDLPERLESETILVFRCLPALATLGLFADATAALLQGNGRFRALATSMFTSAGVFAIAVVVLVQPDEPLTALVVATAIRYAAQLTVGLAAGLRDVTFARPFLPHRATVRDLVRFASRMQLSALTGFVNSELDILVIAALLPVRYAGLYALGLQAAAAARSLPLFAFAPVLTRLAATFRRSGRQGARAEFVRLESRWLPAVLAYGVVSVASVGFLVPIWLGDRYELSGVIAAMLLTGFMIHVAFTGMRTCYVRAVGEPGLEARYSTFWMVGNAILTVPLALVAGVLGVVGATVASGIAASLYFVVLCRRREDLHVILPGRFWWATAVVAALVTVGGELALLATDFHGFLALALALIPPTVGLLLFVGPLGLISAGGARAAPAGD